MSRYNMSKYSNAFDDDNFETVTGFDGQPTRVLKDKGRFRVSLTMRDTVVGTGVDNVSLKSKSQDANPAAIPFSTSQDAKPAFTDGHSTDPLALQRPGYRIPVVNDRCAVHDAYAKYQDELVNAYRVGPVVSDSNPASDAQDHRQTTIDRKTIDQLYAERDAELAEAWRTK